MEEDLVSRKRVRQEVQDDEEDPVAVKKLIVQGETGPEGIVKVDKDAAEYDKMIKSLKKKRK